MAHKGIREWTGEELSNVALGQNGFHIIVNGAVVTAASKGITYWIAIKAVHGSCVCQAQAYGAGDSLSTTGVYGAGNVTLADGDIVYGAFDELDVNNSGDILIAYIGK